MAQPSGEKKTPAEIKRWATRSRLAGPTTSGTARLVRRGCQEPLTDPAKTTTFEWLEIDDKVSHAEKPRDFLFVTSRQDREVVATLRRASGK